MENPKACSTLRVIKDPYDRFPFPPVYGCIPHLNMFPNSWATTQAWLHWWAVVAGMGCMGFDHGLQVQFA